MYIWTGATPPSSPTANVPSATTYNATGLIAGSTYNWYVSPRNAGGAATGCSANSTTFVTAAPPAPVCAVNASPATGTTIASATSATLTWNVATNATSYDVYVWTGATAPSSPTANVTAATYTASGLTASTVYSWYVTPKNVSGSATGCSTSSKSTFTTGSAAPGTGLQGAYYNGTALAGTPLLTRIDPTINFDLPTASPAPGVVPNDNYSVRWTGQVKAQFSETYTFYTVADDGIRMWINGVQLVDNWVNQGATEKSGTITLVAGQKYDVLIEYYEAAGFAFTQFLWSSASTPKAVVPQAQLYPPVGGGALVADAGAGLRVADNTTASASIMASVASTTSSLPTISSTVNPNPVATGQTVKVQITSDKPGAAAISIVNINGLIITTQKVNLVAGLNTTTLNTASLGQGFYIVNITGGTTPLNMKLLVQ